MESEMNHTTPRMSKQKKKKKKKWQRLWRKKEPEVMRCIAMTACTAQGSSKHWLRRSVKHCVLTMPS